jgi:hypothetical protein
VRVCSISVTVLVLWYQLQAYLAACLLVFVLSVLQFIPSDYHFGATVEPCVKWTNDLNYFDHDIFGIKYHFAKGVKCIFP